MAKFQQKNTGAVRLALLAALLLPLCGCAPLSAVFAPLRGGAGAPPHSLTSLGQGLLGPQAGALSAAARRAALQAEYQALEYHQAGQSQSWKSADGSAFGTVMPGQPYRVGEQNCRQYSHDWTVRGLPHSARGSACRNADGSWTPLT